MKLTQDSSAALERSKYSRAFTCFGATSGNLQILGGAGGLSLRHAAYLSNERESSRDIELRFRNSGCSSHEPSRRQQNFSSAAVLLPQIIAD